MSETPRTYQAVNASNGVGLGDPVAVECARLEREVVRITGRWSAWDTCVLAFIIVGLSWSVFFAIWNPIREKRERAEDRKRWLEMTETLSDIARLDGVKAGFNAATHGRKWEDVASIADDLKAGKPWSEYGLSVGAEFKAGPQLWEGIQEATVRIISISNRVEAVTLTGDGSGETNDFDLGDLLDDGGGGNKVGDFHTITNTP